METGAATGESPARGSAGGGPEPPPLAPIPPAPGKPKRRRRWLLRIALALLGLLLVGYLILHNRLNGARLARFVTDEVMNPNIRGRLEVESIQWPVGAILDIRHVDVEIRGIRIYDPGGKLVLWVPQAHGVIDAWELIKPRWMDGHGDIVVHQLDIPKGWCDVSEYPTPAGERDSEIGFVSAFAPKPAVAAAAAAGMMPRRDWIVNLHGARLEHVDLELNFLAWQAHLHDVSTKAWLWTNQRDERNQEFMFSLPIDAGEPATVATARLNIGGQVFDLEHAEITKFGQLPDAPFEMVWALKTRTVEGAVVDTHGRMGLEPPSHDSIELHAGATNVSGLASRYTDGVLRGAGAEVSLDLAGYSSDLKLHVVAKNFDVDARELAPEAPVASIPYVEATYQLGREEANLDRLEIDLLGGKVRGAGTLDISGGLPTFVFDLKLEPPLDLSPWLPQEALRLAGNGMLGGSVRLYGSVKDVWANPIDLQLGRAHTMGAINWSPDTGEVLPIGLRVDVPEAGATARASGSVNVMTSTIALGFNVSVRRLAPWLRRLRAPQVATAASSRGVVSGTFDSPRVSAQVTAEGVPMTGRVDARIDYATGRLTLKELRGSPLGGTFVAGAKLNLAGKRPYINEGWASVSDVKLDKIPGLGHILGGVGSMEITLTGPVDTPNAAVAAVVSDLSVSGEPLGDLEAELRTDEDGLVVDRLQLATPEASLHASGSIGYRGDLDLTLDVAKLPLATLPGLQNEQGLGIDGYASLGLRIGGTTRAATVDGHVGVSQVAFGQTIFGSGGLDISSPAPGLADFAGKLFQGKFTIDGQARLVPPYGVKARIAFKRVEIDEFTPVAAALGIHGWVSGSVELALEDKPRMSLRVTELNAEVDGTDERGRPTPIPIRNVDEIAVEFDGVTARLLHPVRLRTPEGEFTLEGSAGANAFDASLRGEIQLALLEAYTRRYVDRVNGVARVDLRVTGTPAKPVVRGSLSISDVRVMPRGGDTEVTVPIGTFVVTNNLLEVEDLAIEVSGHRLNVGGTVGFVGLEPRRVDAKVQGRLAAELLAVVAGTQVANTSGSAALSLTFKGDLASPSLEGALTFDSSFEVSPRALRREIALTSGKVVFKNNTLTIEDLRGTIDDSALAVRGEVRLAGWEFSSMDVSTRMDALTYRVPGVLEIEANTRLRLYGSATQLNLTGNIDVVDGRYFQAFRVTSLLVPVRTSERTVPFWVGVPLLERLRLDLQVNTTGVFRVGTNWADMQMSGRVRVSNTPVDPRLSGLIRVEEGTIKIPLFRPTFEVEGGTVSFSQFERAADGVTVDVSGRSLYVDRDERQHNVRMHVYGSLARLVFDLSTEEGLNSAQTFVLISAGRTADEVREQARGDSETVVPTDASQSGSGGSVGGGGGVAGTADRLVKDFASDFLTVMIEEPLKNKTGLDCVRLEIGTESSLAYGCIKLARGVRLEGEYEYGYQGRQRQKLGFTMKLTDRFSLSGLYENRTLADDEDENDSDLSLELKYRWTIK